MRAPTVLFLKEQAQTLKNNADTALICHRDICREAEHADQLDQMHWRITMRPTPAKAPLVDSLRQNESAAFANSRFELQADRELRAVRAKAQEILDALEDIPVEPQDVALLRRELLDAQIAHYQLKLNTVMEGTLLSPSVLKSMEGVFWLESRLKLAINRWRQERRRALLRKLCPWNWGKA